MFKKKDELKLIIFVSQGLTLSTASLVNISYLKLICTVVNMCGQDAQDTHSFSFSANTDGNSEEDETYRADACTHQAFTVKVHGLLGLVKLK